MTVSEVPLLPGIGGLIDAYDGVILDVWGVLHDGAKPFPFVLDTLHHLKAHGKKTLVLSNAPRRAVPVSHRLTDIGIARDLYDHIHTSGEETWQHLTRRDETFYQTIGRACFMVAAVSNDNRASTSVETRPGTMARIFFPKATAKCRKARLATSLSLALGPACFLASSSTSSTRA